MSTLTPRSASPVRGIHAPFLPAFSALWAGAVQAWRTRRADRAMHELSDEMLHDIGVARSEIEDVTRHGRTARH